MNVNVNVTYRLSHAGQKAALLAGKAATQVVNETMELANTDLLGRLTISPEGELSFQAETFVKSFSRYAMELDAPPSSLEDLIGCYDRFVTEKKAEIEADEIRANEAREEAKERRRVEEEKRQAEIDADAAEVESILAAVEADPLAALPEGVELWGTSFWKRADGKTHYFALSPDGKERAVKASQLRQNAIAAQKEAEKAATVAEHGGHWWDAAGGMCNFLGYGLWSGRQDKRWVGRFSAARGINKFLPSPRGEQTFDVRGLRPGDCIQGGGYDENKRGRRSNESGFFGVVVKNDETGLVVDICDTRAEALTKARGVK